MTRLRVGTRGSALALAQARWVAERLDGEIVVLRTSGDAGVTGDKSRWVDSIERALVAEEIDLAVHSAKDVPGELAPGTEIDLAVHSAKDVPGELAPGTEIVATPERAPAHDVMIGEGRRVGTSSLRRRAQLLAAGDAEVVEMRGNVDTRLRKLAGGEVDAIVLAAAGLLRLGRDEPAVPLDGELFVPAPGQGVLALQARAGDHRARDLDHEETHACLAAERAAVRVLEADCHTPVGVHACGGRMRGFVGRPDGSAWLLDEIGSLDGAELGRRLLAAGARELLA